MDDYLIKEYLDNSKDKGSNKVKALSRRIVSKLLLSIIFLLVSIILINRSDKVKAFYQENIYTNSWSFTKFNSLYNKYFGSLVKDYQVPDTSSVFNETLSYSHIEDYLNGSILSVSNNYMVPVIESGIIVYLGDKDALKNTCIVQGVDGVDIWYSNIDISKLTLMDYVNKGEFLSTTLSDKLYLTLERGNEYIKYEDYQN
ncbi:MAG TPA: hypothetical protein DHU33_04300 [Firmicutes bacterium]|nr:hypothetical protein [Bacillota bacterium]